MKRKDINWSKGPLRLDFHLHIFRFLLSNNCNSEPYYVKVEPHISAFVITQLYKITFFSPVFVTFEFFYLSVCTCMY